MPDRAGANATAPVLPRLDQHVCFALHAASGMVTQLYRPLLEPLGLTYPQYLVMVALWEKAPRSAGELSDALSVDAATLSPVLKRMEANGLLSRRRDPRDERRLVIEPTEAGLALRERAAGVPHAMLCQLPLGADELDRLRGTLEKIVRLGRAANAPGGQAGAAAG